MKTKGAKQKKVIGRALRIAGKVLLGLFLTVYVLVALVNYSVVQSLVGSWASSYLSKELKAEIHIGSIGFSVFDHVRLHNVLMCEPSGDTVLSCERLTVTFDGMPITSDGLYLRRVSLRNGQYNLRITEEGINLKFIIDYFKSEKKKEKAHGPFIVHVNSVRLSNMRYSMRLKNYQSGEREHGINPKAMDYYDLDIRMRNVRVENDNVTLKMESLSAKEKSGLEVKNFSGFVYVTPHGISVTDMDVETGDSHIMGDVMLRYNGWKDMGDYIENVHMLADLKEGSVGSMRDAAFWAPVLWDMDQKINISGLFYGPVADLHAENVALSFGTMTSLTLNGYITGLTEMRNTIINGRVTDMVTCIEDIRQMRYPERVGAIKLPEKLAAVSPLQLNEVTFIGTIYEFMASADLTTTLGDVKADAIMQQDSKTGDYQYIGNLKSDNFHLKTILPNEYVSGTGFDITVQGTGFDPDSLQASANAILHNVVMHGQRIDLVEVNAEMKGKNIEADLYVQDPLADMTVSTELDLGKPQNEYNATANVENLDLAKLKLVSADSVMRFSGQVSMNMHGNSLDELGGSVMLTKVGLQLPDRTIRLNEVSLLARSMDDFKNLTLDCDMLHFVAKGYFNYSDFGAMTKDFCDRYVPVYHNPFYGSVSDTSKKYVADFSMELTYNDSSDVLGTIVPGLFLSDGTTLTGSYSDVESLRFKLKTDSIRYGSVLAANVNMDGKDRGGRYMIDLDADKLAYADAMTMRNVGVDIESQSSDAAMHVTWDDKDKLPTNGNLNIRLQSTSEMNIVKVLNSSFAVKGEKWDVVDNNALEYGPKMFSVEGLQLLSAGQSLKIDGYVSPDSTDLLNLNFKKFDVSVFDILLGDIGLSMGGKLDGHVSVLDFYKTLHYTANLDIEDWQLNGRDMGNAKILSRWDAENRRIGVLLTSVISDDDESRYPVNMKGFYYPDKDGGTLDFNATFNGFDLESVAPYLSSFSSRFEGGLHGDFDIEGTIDKPSIKGEAIIDNGLIKVDMFNTMYRFSDTVFISGNKILFNNFEFSDLRDNNAKVNGVVSHNHFKDFYVDLSLVSDNIMVMNTTPKDNDDFYGTLFANVNGTVKGPVKNLSVVANATTTRGSSFSIPLSDKQQISEQNYVRFVPRERRPGAARPRTTANSTHYKVIVNIAANPNVRLSLPMDFNQLTALVTATGSGNLQLSIASGSDFNLSGDYIIQSGSFKIDLMDLISRELTLEPGSSLSWTGNPTDANIDIKGVYAQRVNLASLYAASQSVDHTSKTVNVESVIALSGQLLNPSIKFDFRLPNADQSTEEEVYARIDRTNEREMMNQTISLLAFSQFYSETPNAGSFNALSSGIGIAANTVSSVVSSMVDFVDVNINYKSGDELVTNQLDIDISKEWNRFYFETSFGIGGDAKTLNQLDDGSANTIIGDVLVGYKISPNFHLIAFNRSNANDYTKVDLPYTQGVGIKYSKDFDTWKSLFAPKKKKKGASDKKDKKK